MDLSYLSRLGLKAFPLAKQPLSKPIQTLEQFTLDILKEIRKDLKEFKVIPYGGGICVAINRMIEFKISEYLKTTEDSWITIDMYSNFHNSGKLGLEDCGMQTKVIGLIAIRVADVFRAKAALWPKHSGSKNYPVPSPTLGLRHSEAYLTLGIWTGEYGELRIQLLDFVIENLENELQ